MYRRILTTCLLLAVVAFGTAGCGQTAELDPVTPEEPAGSSTLVVLDASGRVESDVLYVEGTATVPDGALLIGVADNRTRATPDDAWTITDRGYSSAEVFDEAFAFQVSVEGWEGDSVRVWIAFFTGIAFEAEDGSAVEQPAEVIELYGETGEHMEGDIREVEDMNAVVIEFDVAR